MNKLSTGKYSYVILLLKVLKGTLKTLKMTGGFKMSCNQETCTCTNIECPRHGKCCECINFHLEKGTPVSCMKKMLKSKNN